MSEKGMVVLQNCLDLPKFIPDSYHETYLTPHDEYQAISIKVEEVTVTQEDDDPLLITFPEINAEHEVSFMVFYPLLSPFHKYPELDIVFLISISCLLAWNKSSLVKAL
jgi:hypothetical protein